MTRLAQLVRWALAGSLFAWLAALGAYALDARPLGVPVRGLSRARIHSTFGAPRDGGRRRHHGADLFARRGTPVLAAHDGVVVYVGVLRLGGNVVATLGRRGVVAYYAHLDRVQARRGELVAEGEPLGTVGNTGNARTTPPHLHFGTYVVAYGLAPVDPVPLLRAP